MPASTAPRRRRHKGTRAPRLAPAMTLLEVVLAVTLLSMIAAAVLGTIGAINTMEANNRNRLAAYEVANRIMLMYLDDKGKMPDKNLPLDIGSRRFFWDLSELGATMEINAHQAAGPGSQLNALGRYRLVGVTVFESLDRGDGLVVPGEPVAALSRLIDPSTPRNPDSIAKLDREGIGQMIRDIFGDQTPIPTGPNAPRTGPAPRNNP